MSEDTFVTLSYTPVDGRPRRERLRRREDGYERVVEQRDGDQWTVIQQEPVVGVDLDVDLEAYDLVDHLD